MSKFDTLAAENQECDVVQGRECLTLVTEWKIEFLCFLTGRGGVKEDKEEENWKNLNLSTILTAH